MSRKLRVLSIATLYPNDLTPNFGIFVERQMQAVAARGDVDLTVINPIGMPPFPFSLHPRYRARHAIAFEELRGGVPVLRPRFRLIPKIGARFNARAIARVTLPLARRLSAEAAFDVVDAQFFYPDGPAAVAVAEALGLPSSIKARGSDILYCGVAQDTGAQVVAAGQRATGLLAVAGGLVEAMVALGMPRERIAIHRTGLDRSRFRPLDRGESRAALGLPADAPVLVTVGALVPRKGQLLAIEALRLLPAAHLVLAGAGEELGRLKAAAVANGVAERVHFLGPVPHAELPQVISAADVFVLPTESEGLANAWVEALACGVPVVTSDIPGARELITDPAWGTLVPRDPVAIAAAVRTILAAPPARGDVLRGAEGFSWEANAAALVEHWRRLAAGT